MSGSSARCSASKVASFGDNTSDETAILRIDVLLEMFINTAIGDEPRPESRLRIIARVKFNVV